MLTLCMVHYIIFVECSKATQWKVVSIVALRSWILVWTSTVFSPCLFVFSPGTLVSSFGPKTCLFSQIGDSKLTLGVTVKVIGSVSCDGLSCGSFQQVPQ